MPPSNRRPGDPDGASPRPTTQPSLFATDDTEGGQGLSALPEGNDGEVLADVIDLAARPAGASVSTTDCSTEDPPAVTRRSDRRAEPLPRPDLPDYERFANRLTALGNCTTRTAQTYAAVSRIAVDWFTIHRPGVPLLELTAEDIEDYLIALDKRGLSTSTRRGAVYALRKLYTYIGRTPGRTINPAAQVKAPVQRSKRPEPWTCGELDRLLAAVLAAAEAAPSDRARVRARFDHAVLATFRYTGLRLTELCDLDTAHVRVGARRLEVHHGKGGHQRFVPIPVPLARILKAYLAEVRPHCPESPRLFANPYGYPGTAVYGQLAHRAAFDIVTKYAERAGLDGDAHPHRLRHSFATDHYRKGTAIPVIAKLLGHSSILTTVRYLGLTKDDLTAAVDAAYPGSQQAA